MAVPSSPSRPLFELLVQGGAPVLAVAVAADGRVLAAEGATETLLGVGPDALTGRDWFAFVPPAIRETARTWLQETVTDPSVRRPVVVVPVVHRNGRERPVLWANVLAPDGFPGAAATFLGIDLSDHAGALGSGRRSDLDAGWLLDRLPVAVTVYEPGRGGTFYSRGALEVLGYSAADLERRPTLWFDSIVPEDRDRVRGAVARAPTEGPLDVTYRIRDAEGSLRWLEERIFALNPATGSALVTVARDITARRRAETSADQLALILDTMDASVILTDPDGVILWANPRACETSGYRLDELEGRRPNLLSSGRTPEETYGELWRTILRGGTWTGEFVNRRKDGTLYHERAVISAIRDESGAIAMFFAIKEDITEKLELELQLRHAQRLETVGRTAAGVAHDLNNMLTAMLAQAEMLRAVAPDLDEESAEAVDGIIEASLRAAEVTRGLVHSSRADGGAAAELVEPEGLLRRLRALEPGLTRRAPVRLALDGEADGRVRGTPAELHQVLQNLCVNAADAMPEGGTIRVRLDTLELARPRRGRFGVIPEGAWVRFQVEDEGVGMSDEIVERIFEAFFTTKDDGTGLGLAVTRGIVDRHRGHLDLETTPGQGTVFTVLFPRVDAEAAPAGDPAAKPVPAREGRRGSIVLVDDEEGVRRSYARVFTREGFHVRAASSAEDALELLADALPDLVVTDLVMPGRSGAEFFEAVRREHPDLPFVFSSGWAASSDVHRILAEPRTEFVPKPPETMNALIEAVERLLADDA